MSKFNGAGYDPKRDDERLTGQIGRVYDAMLDGQWHQLRNIANVTGDPESSVSAQLRHLRKERFGAHNIQRRYISHGLHEYRMTRSLLSPLEAANVH